MPQVRVSELTTGEIAVYDTDSGELIIVEQVGVNEWNASNKTLESAKKIAEIGKGYVMSKKQLKTLLLATDRVILLT